MFAFSPQHEYLAAAVSAYFSIPVSLARSHKKQLYKVMLFLQPPMLVMSIFNSSWLKLIALSFSMPTLNSLCLNLSPLLLVQCPRKGQEHLAPFLSCSSLFFFSLFNSYGIPPASPYSSVFLFFRHSNPTSLTPFLAHHILIL